LRMTQRSFPRTDRRRGARGLNRRTAVPSPREKRQSRRRAARNRRAVPCTKSLRRSGESALWTQCIPSRPGT
jgi:hypothetical protein